MKTKLTTINRLFLNFLVDIDNNQRNAILKTLTNEQLQILVEIIYNLLKGSLPISKKYKDLLYPNKQAIRKVVDESISKHLRRKRLLKISNDLPIILRNFLKYESRINTHHKKKI